MFGCVNIQGRNEDVCRKTASTNVVGVRALASEIAAESLQVVDRRRRSRARRAPIIAKDVPEVSRRNSPTLDRSSSDMLDMRHSEVSSVSSLVRSRQRVFPTPFVSCCAKSMDKVSRLMTSKFPPRATHALESIRAQL